MAENRIAYERNNPCRHCGGQVMAIYSNGKMKEKYCVKCGKDVKNKRPRPKGIEECMGRLMHRYYTEY